MVTLLLIAACASSQAPPEKPLGSPEQNAQTGTQAGQATDDLRRTNQRPLVVQIQKSTAEAAKEQSQEQQQASDRNWTRGVAIFTLLIAGLQWWLLRRQATIADHQVAIIGKQLTTTQAIERAYAQPFIPSPGATFFHVTTGETLVTVQMVVKNRGRTPGRVTDSAIKLTVVAKGAPPPPPARPTGQGVLRAFLVTDAEVAIGDRITISEADELAIREAETKTLYAVGYIDYIDKFNGRHRAGIAHVYSKAHDQMMRMDIAGAKPGTNLSLLDGTAYNYDRPREKGEGNDWEESQEPRS